MVDLHKLFTKFNGEITLTSTKKDNLKTGRGALRKKIKDKFTEKGRTNPKFCGQGSFMMKTTVNPINGEYDLDDGVYIQGYSDMEQTEWPVASTIHKWIYDAVENHTSTAPINKDTCVRVIYVNYYHIDLPSYIVKDDVAYLAHKRDGWVVSDPKAFTDWFIGKVKDEGEQLRSLVKYLKAWKDYKGIDFKGIAITILVGENFYPYEKRDDLALLGTITQIIDTLESDFKCVKPVAPNEDIFKGISETKKTNILDGLRTLKDKIQEAVNKEDEEEASNLMIDCFGSRFPKGEKTSKNSTSSYVTTSSPSILKNDGRSA
ncbi:cyclic GMP-AMP synthase DncV-like nucleotidyltransferase [uncultured Clostridium sp.]|uniref:cyclic GMP-AMP synthase DncV-like nucleotidyltransferase n=1 Tax=uncultured Clostridium sp. TaxID=59620 RepID=UPI00321738F1